MTTTLSHYRVLERLGGGAMGEVYKAEDLRLKRMVALKFLSPRSASDGQYPRRFVEEAQRAASLNHPSIATIYELGREGDLLYIAMEFIEGESLAQRITRERMEISEIVDIAIQSAEALRVAHEHGCIHCDIKSSNIMLTFDGAVKVLDFGLARMAQADTEETLDPALVGICELAGTPSYMSPEQARGESLDLRTDLFSLGVVLFEMITSRLPFEGESHARILRAVLDQDTPPLGNFREDVPLELEAIVRRAVEKNRQGRYASAKEMMSDLKRLRDRLEPPAYGKFVPGKERVAQFDFVESEIPESAPHLKSRDQLDPIRRYRRWIVGLSVFALLAAALDFILIRPQGLYRLRDALLLLIGFLGYAVYRRLNIGAMRPVHRATGGTAFRGLLPFQEADRNRFYGREAETAALFELITHTDFRFGVLYGDSGSGKTSLIRAALLPRLWEEGYVPLYCRSYKDPLAALLEECRRQSGVETGEGEPVVSYLRRVAYELDARLVVICDQFEEFFVNFKTSKERHPFVEVVARCLSAGDMPVKFLFSMRSDFLYLIGAEFDPLVVEPLASSRRFHLRNFDEDQAANIIAKSVRRVGLPFEPGLSHQVARDLAVSDVVLPSELQIVGERLQSKRIYTVAAYRRAGGKEQLVHGFLEDVVQTSRDVEAAKLLLRSLISDENTRLTLPLDEIARRTQRSEASIERLLDHFVESRLIRAIQDETPWRYELMHEYLIERINRITGRVMDATQRANRLLRQYVSDHSVDRGALIPISKVWFIRRYSDIEKGERERKLLRKSLVRGGLKSILLILLLIAAATAAAAALSIREEWEGTRLSDGHTAAVRQAAFSPDGRLLVSVGEDAKVIVWDFASREQLATFTDHTGWIYTVAFSPDGRWFATGGADQTVIVWDARRLQKVTTLRGHTATVAAVAFSPDGRLLATSGTGDSTIIWKVGEWQKLLMLSPTVFADGRVIFTSDSRQLVSSMGEVWDVTTGRKEPTSFEDGNWFARSPDQSRSVIIGGSGVVYFEDLIHKKITGTYRAHQDNGRGAAFSPDGKLVATAAENIILWDAATETKVARLEHAAIVWNVNFSPDGRWLVSTHGDGAILLWDVAERVLVANFNEHSGPVRTVAYSPDGKRLASAGEDDSIILWNPETRRKEATLVGHGTRVTAVAFSPDGKWMASCDQDALIILWDIDQRKLIWGHTQTDEIGINTTCYCIAFSPDGRYLATSNTVLESETGRVVARFLEGSTVYGVAFSPDGRRLARLSYRGYISLLNTADWQEAYRQEVRGTQLINVSYSPDSRRLVTGESEGNIRLWETEPLRQVGVIGRHSARVKSVAFSPDGRHLASAGDDQTIALWDVDGPGLVTRIGSHTAPVLSVAFSPDGRHLVSGEHDKSVRVYTRHRTLWGFELD